MKNKDDFRYEGKPLRTIVKSTLFNVSKDEWDTKEDTGQPYLDQLLPVELLLVIFSFLRERDLCHVMLVCQQFNNVANDSYDTTLWRDLFRRVFEMSTSYSYSYYDNMYKMVCPQDGLTWKQHFEVMHGSLHVHPKMATLSKTHPLRLETKQLQCIVNKL
ncbi:F-box only protein 11-like isoform X3 [Dysidea avara]|uniref:F-box only protein 11-like isoform X3 n=1 Tax=Dysidea avara TaxID=196820 RepID=UPI003331EAC3